MGTRRGRGGRRGRAPRLRPARRCSAPGRRARKSDGAGLATRRQGGQGSARRDPLPRAAARGAQRGSRDAPARGASGEGRRIPTAPLKAPVLLGPAVGPESGRGRGRRGGRRPGRPPGPTFGICGIRLRRAPRRQARPLARRAPARAAPSLRAAARERVHRPAGHVGQARQTAERAGAAVRVPLARRHDVAVDAVGNPVPRAAPGEQAAQARAVRPPRGRARRGAHIDRFGPHRGESGEAFGLASLSGMLIRPPCSSAPMASSKRTPNDDRSDSLNPRTRAGKAAAAEHARQVAENKKR